MLHGQHLIGASTSREGHEAFRAVSPLNERALEPDYVEAMDSEIDRALALAADAHLEMKHRHRTVRATLLDRVAEEIEALGDTLLERAEMETALPRARLQGERGRTVGQLRMFADLVREGSWVDACIDRARPNDRPPTPDLRRLRIPLGPVVVFGASNFPLAFSVGGGDTASALAAGCPVIVKAHPNHPGTSELVGGAIRAAVLASRAPAGMFSLLHGATTRVGLALVRHPSTRAVAFTGSLRGGRAIFDAATSRPTPIPAYAEMGSVNPVFLLPDTLSRRGPSIAEGLFTSIVLGVGQFCTNPGLIIVPNDEAGGQFTDVLSERVASARPGVLLHVGIRRTYDEGLARLRSTPGVQELARGAASPDGGPCAAGAGLFRTDVEHFLENPVLREEVFGPSTLIVRCPSSRAFSDVARALEGQLTATVHGTEEDLETYPELVSILEDRVGRLVFNGYPTGVQVCRAMHHGGPFPATTDARTTSVGTAAIERFARPICYQDLPARLLPEELQDGNPAGIMRLVDGVWTR